MDIPSMFGIVFNLRLHPAKSRKNLHVVQSQLIDFFGQQVESYGHLYQPGVEPTIYESGAVSSRIANYRHLPEFSLELGFKEILYFINYADFDGRKVCMVLTDTFLPQEKMAYLKPISIANKNNYDMEIWLVAVGEHISVDIEQICTGVCRLIKVANPNFLTHNLLGKLNET